MLVEEARLSLLLAERTRLLETLVEERVLLTDNGVPSVADGSSTSSIRIAALMYDQLPVSVPSGVLIAGQTSGKAFERCIAAFLARSLAALAPLHGSRLDVFFNKVHAIQDFEQYKHLQALKDLSVKHPEIASLIGQDYLIRPDVVVTRRPLHTSELLDPTGALLVNASQSNSPAVNGLRALHASVSCKLTIRSDRSQNARSEALNLMRLRNGRVPHIMIVTAEPLPGRILSIALGSGDMDCTYHMALPELRAAALAAGQPHTLQLERLVETRRIRDIADLPVDLL